MTYPAFLLLLAATASLVPTSCATNLLRKASVNDGDLFSSDRPSAGDSAVIRASGAISHDYAHSMLLDTSIQRFQQPYRQESLLASSTSLTGYMMTALYDDAACTKFQLALASILNTCTAAGGEYMKLTATATGSLTTYYSDKECTKVTSTGTPKTFPIGCVSSMMMYVSANGVPTTSSAVVGISRYVVVSITLSCHSLQSSSCCFLRLLMKLRLESYESTCDPANVIRLKDSLTDLTISTAAKVKLAPQPPIPSHITQWIPALDFH